MKHCCELRFRSYRVFAHASLSRVPLCVSWAFLVELKPIFVEKLCLSVRGTTVFWYKKFTDISDNCCVSSHIANCLVFWTLSSVFQNGVFILRGLHCQQCQACRGYKISYPYPYPQIFRGFPWIYPYSQTPLLRLSLIHIWRCRRSYACRSRWSPYH